VGNCRKSYNKLVYMCRYPPCPQNFTSYPRPWFLFVSVYVREGSLLLSCSPALLLSTLPHHPPPLCFPPPLPHSHTFQLHVNACSKFQVHCPKTKQNKAITNKNKGRSASILTATPPHGHQILVIQILGINPLILDP